MGIRSQSDIWIYRIVIVLGAIVSMSAIGASSLMLTGHPVPELLAVLGAVAIGGLARLFISPLNRELSITSLSSGTMPEKQPEIRL